jgi:hypothetical protein
MVSQENIMVGIQTETVIQYVQKHNKTDDMHCG